MTNDETERRLATLSEAADRKLDQIWDAIKRLQADHYALLAILKETPSGDNEAVLSGSRWASYMERIEKELNSLRPG